MNPRLFQGRCVFWGMEAPHRAADLLEQFADKPEPLVAYEVAQLLVDAARSGDSDLFRKLGNWVDLAKGVKRAGLKVDLQAVDTAIWELISHFESEDPPVRPTAKDLLNDLHGLGLKVSESTIKARLRLLRGKSKPGRPRKSAESR